ncbi:MAG: C1 family peptidase [Spirochaetota bacterium]|jgi:hypothetical protein|nr:C1 family peptidase [Spirochaetota bacterium]
MTPYIRILSIAFLLLTALSISGDEPDEYGQGALMDPDLYESIDQKPVLLTRDYVTLPKAHSLKHYSPFPGNQGQYGTCNAWANAYAARTILESIALGRTNRTLITENVFSPAFLYKSISNDPTCRSGTYIDSAMRLMKHEGIVKRLPVEEKIDFRDISLSLFTTNRRYPISDFVRVFLRWGSGAMEEKARPVKKSIAEGKPVIISMLCPPSFTSPFPWAPRIKDVWIPQESFNRNLNGHAMCVVGYDDDKFGGAFEVQNSWGTFWGDGGYFWIRYADFAVWVVEAYEIIENLSNFKNSAQYGAAIKTEIFLSKANMPVRYNPAGFYSTLSSYPTGTDFRFLMTNKYPAYVYAFSADSATPDVTHIFPSKGVSPVMDYSGSTVAWPGETKWIRMDEKIGTDYLVVLYSKEALDIAAIETRFANEKGAFPARVARAVGHNFIPHSQAQYTLDTIEFSAQSPNPKAVFGLLLAIGHR